MNNCSHNQKGLFKIKVTEENTKERLRDSVHKNIKLIHTEKLENFKVQHKLENIS